MTPFAIVAALAVGITLGLLGAGGSILTVPALIFALGVDPKVAIVMGLPIVGGASFVGAVRQWMQRNIELRVAMSFGVANMVGAYGGAVIARALSGTLQLTLLAFVMVASAVSMLTNSGQVASREPSAAEPRRVSGLMLLLGVATGTLTGMVGVGGGFILVPALVVLGRLSMREATGTSLTVITMNTLAASAGYRGVVDVPWMLVLAFGALTAVGVLIGDTFASRVKERVLRRAFGILLLLVTAVVLARLKTLFGA